MAIRIVSDSTCDLPVETISRYGISVVPLYINVGGKGFLDGIEMTRSEFYEKLPSFPVHPTTAVPSIEKFRAVYENLSDEGATQVLSIHISAALSGVIDIATLAARQITSIEVSVLDSRQLSLGTGFLVETAGKMAAAGHTIVEILSALKEQINRSYVFAALDTLEFLKRSGRMNRFVAGLGTQLQIKPILTMVDGVPGTEKVRTRERATKRLLEMVGKVGALERLAILHTNAPERVAELQNLAASLMPGKEISVANLTPVIGAHIGPGAYGFAVLGARN